MQPWTPHPAAPPPDPGRADPWLLPGIRALGVAALLGLLLSPHALAQGDASVGVDDAAEAQVEEEAPPDAAAATAGAGERLPAARTTRHELAFADRTLRFAATAGSLALGDRPDEPEADIAFVAYALEGAAAAGRPVTFVVNGGPGAASAYLHLGGLGPWRLPLVGDSIVPSQSVALVPNADTWLDFTDLVFVDPVGTGFSRLVEPDDRMRERYLSIDGDVEAISGFILRWLVENGRMASPKYFVGESYGGFRGPLVAEALQTDFGVGLSGMTLVSPVLDFGWWRQPDYNPLPTVALLPSLAAAGMEKGGTFSPDALDAVEDYATGEYVADLLRGLQDTAAVARTVARVAELTGLDPDVVEDYAGRLGQHDFTREIFRDERRVASGYDAILATDDPAPGRRGRAPDPVLDALTAPLTGAMLDHYEKTLEWLPERRYVLLNGRVNRAWDWGDSLTQPQVVEPLGRVLALDDEFRLLVVHGYTDLVTPYFASEMILRQLGPAVGERVRQSNYRGGHMFYMRDDSRRAFRRDAARLYGTVGN